MKFARFVILLLVATSFAFKAPVKDVKLEYKFKTGDQYDLSQFSKQNIKQEIPGMGEMSIDITIEGSMSFKVVEVTATGAKIETSYTGIKMITKSPMGDNTMDSQGPDDNAQNKAVKALINKPFFIYMNKQGTIEKVENLDNLYSGFSEADAASAAQMKQSYGESTIKASLEMALPSYPEKGAVVGATWKSSTSASAGFPIITESTWTFAKVDGAVANLESDGTIVTPDAEKITMLNGMKTKSNLAGRQMMKAKVDVKTGWPSELTAISEIKGDLTLLAGGPIPEDMKVPMVINGESTFKIVKK